MARRQGSLKATTVSTPYSAQLTASGGGTQTWSLPAGVKFSQRTGAFSGTPRRAGK